MRQPDFIVKEFLMKKPNGTKKLVKLKFSRTDMSKPIYILRSE